MSLFPESFQRDYKKLGIHILFLPVLCKVFDFNSYQQYITFKQSRNAFYPRPV
jgi:hypothetical protein